MIKTFKNLCIPQLTSKKTNDQDLKKKSNFSILNHALNLKKN